MRIWGGIFDVELKEKELVQLEQRMTASDFWDDNESARETVDKVASFKNIINPYRSLCKEVEDFLALAELVFEEGAESEFLEEADEAWQSLEEGLEKLELFSFLKGKHDAAGAFLSINAGAGGTESCDWANMLYRMYTRWVERHDMKYEIIDYQAGDEAGIKSVTIRIMGENAFGFSSALSAEFTALSVFLHSILINVVTHLSVLWMSFQSLMTVSKLILKIKT